MKRIFIISGSSIFSHGLASLLGNEPTLATVGQEGNVDQAIQQILELQPDAIILNGTDTADKWMSTVMRLLTECAGVKVIGLSLRDNCLHIYQAEHRVVQSLEDLLSAIEPDAPLAPEVKGKI